MADRQNISEEAQKAKVKSLNLVLSNADSEGINAALDKYGSGLTEEEKNVLSTLTPDELKAISSVKDKLSNSLINPNEFSIRDGALF